MGNIKKSTLIVAEHYYDRPHTMISCWPMFSWHLHVHTLYSYTTLLQYMRRTWKNMTHVVNQTSSYGMTGVFRSPTVDVESIASRVFS